MPAEHEIRADYDRDTIVTDRVRKVYGVLQSGKADKAKRHLPPERVYPVGGIPARRLMIANGR